MLMRQNVSDTIIVIPARMAATRLPGKPLRQIGDAPMIVQVWRRAIEAVARHAVCMTVSLLSSPVSARWCFVRDLLS